MNERQKWGGVGGMMQISVGEGLGEHRSEETPWSTSGQQRDVRELIIILLFSTCR